MKSFKKEKEFLMKYSFKKDIAAIINGEPNYLKFSYKGYFCYLNRHPFFLHWCGYVGITKLTPKYYKKGFNEIPIDCHGGLNFSGFKSQRWHVKKNKKTWFIGFDCGHYNDIQPVFIKLYKNAGFINPGCINFFSVTYRDIYYCIYQCKNIVDQILE